MPLTRLLTLLAVSPWFAGAGQASANIAVATPFSINWTAPGDDGWIGRATAVSMGREVGSGARGP